jgi:hypothetical protein
MKPKIERWMQDDGEDERTAQYIAEDIATDKSLRIANGAHTPGPWFKFRGGVWAMVNGKRRLVATLPSAWDRDLHPMEGSEQKRADEDLIAAAPFMRDRHGVVYRKSTEAISLLDAGKVDEARALLCAIMAHSSESIHVSEGR